MKRRIAAVAIALTWLLTGLGAGIDPRPVSAQDQTEPDSLFKMTLDQGSLPAAPAFVRLLRINMDPGSNSPLHTHPGPELWHIDAGTVTAFVQGPTLLARAEDPSKIEQAPQNSEFTVSKGDLVALLPGSAMTFTNKGDDVAKILTIVILPAGNQRPPGIQYVGNQPSDNAFKGINSEILGDGVATTLPAGAATISVDRLKLTSGQPIPAVSDPVMLSVAKGGLDFNVVGGSVQVSRTAEPGPQPDAATGTSYSLAKGDAVFFPGGMKESARTSAFADVTLYRLTISGEGDTATPASTASAPGDIQVTGPAAPVETPTPTATPEPAATPTAAPGQIQSGVTVYVTEDDVRLRSGPTTESEIVTGMVKGQALIVTGPAEQGDNFTWWPVQDANDPSVAGYVAEPFITTEPPEQ